MSEFFKNNLIALRHCLLFEVLQGVSIENAYSKFCNTLGEDFMEYKEFEFWYQRFSDGNYDMNFERDWNENEKITELSDMPLDIMEKIVGHLDIFDRSALARTSRSLQKFVEDQKLFHDNLIFETGLHDSKMKFGEKTKIVYIRKNYDCVKHFVTSEELIEDVPHWKHALLDFQNILKKPKLHLDSLNINYIWDESRCGCKNCHRHEQLLVGPDEIINELETALKSTHLLNVKKLSLEADSFESLRKVLLLLKPGYLTDIVADINKPKVDELEKIGQLEQWKQAKYFELNGLAFDCPPHHFYHFKEFFVFLKNVSAEHIRQMKEILFNSPDFEKGSILIESPVDTSAMEQELGDSIPGSEDIYHYRIPNSTEYFEIKREDYWDLKIERKKF